jgi:hypothetical protein
VLRCGLDRAILDRLALRGGELTAERSSAGDRLDFTHRCPDGYLAFTDGTDVLLVLS